MRHEWRNDAFRLRARSAGQLSEELLRELAPHQRAHVCPAAQLARRRLLAPSYWSRCATGGPSSSRVHDSAHDFIVAKPGDASSMDFEWRPEDVDALESVSVFLAADGTARLFRCRSYNFRL